MSPINRLFRAVRDGSLNAGRTHARQHLLARGDRFLADNGFSRELLEQGNRAWPWRTEAPDVGVAVRVPLASTPSDVGTPPVQGGAATPTPIAGAASPARVDAATPDPAREAA